MLSEYLERRRERRVRDIRARYPDETNEIKKVALHSDMDRSEVDELILDSDGSRRFSKKILRGYQIGGLLTAIGVSLGGLGLPVTIAYGRQLELREVVGGVILLAGISNYRHRFFSSHKNNYFFSFLDLFLLQPRGPYQ